MTRVALAAVLGAVAWVTPAQGQRVRLDFAPPVGVPLHRSFQVHTRLTVSPAADRERVLETAELGSLRQISLPGPGGPVVHLAFDSLIGRVREDAAPWREFRVSGLDTLWVQAVVDERLRLQATRTRGERSAALLLHVFTGMPGFELPAVPVATGDQWAAELAVPLAGLFARSPDAGIPGDELTTRLRLTADSVVARAHDTLAYVSFVGTFRPKVVRRGDERLAYAGGARGTLVWSSGWRGPVAVVARVRVLVDVGDGTEGRPPGRVVLESTLRESVTP